MKGFEVVVVPDIREETDLGFTVLIKSGGVANIGEVRRRKDGFFKKESAGKWRRMSDYEVRSHRKEGKLPSSVAGMSENEVHKVLSEASRKGHEAKSAKDRYNIWSKAYEGLFGHLDMFRMPGGEVDPATIKINFKVLQTDPHSKGFISFKDSSGKYQTGQTVEHRVRQDAVKWSRMKDLAKQQDKVKTAHSNLTKTWQDKSQPKRDRDAAAILDIIMKTGLRRGLERNYQKKGNRGVTTLHTDDIKIDSDTIRISFVGKHGKMNEAEITDPLLAKYIGSRKEEAQKAGKTRLFEASDRIVNRVLNQSGSPTNRPKDFRTIKATRIAKDQFDQTPPPMYKGPGGKEMTMPAAVHRGYITREQALGRIADAIMDVASHVGKELNNDSHVSRDSYVHPEVIHNWMSSHGLEDLTPNWMDPYKKWKESQLRRGLDPFDDLLDLMKGNLMDYLKNDKGNPHVAVDAEPEEDPELEEEDTFMVPNWVLAYTTRSRREED